MDPASLLLRAAERLGQGFPEPECTVSDRQLRANREAAVLETVKDLQ